MARTRTETHSIQTWPGGEGYTYRGDPYGPPARRALRVTQHNGADQLAWRKGTAAEWRTIRIALRAEGYQRHEVLCCDSALVGDLLQLGGEGGGDLARAFDADAMRNVYADPSDWDADQCREYAEDHGIDLPEGEACAEHATREAACPACQETDEDDSPRGWLTEARDACREYAQDHPAEVYEWWRVSSWLCDQLDAIGEVTIDNDYGTWWGRCTTGQRLIMDGVLQQVAAQYEQEED